MNRRLARLAALLCLLAPIALAEVGCAGVTAADLEPHVATARDLAERNNAAIAVHCVGMPLEDRQALIRDNIDHAAQLAALQQSADDGPGWISQVIAWALSFSRLAGIVAADPQMDGPDERAMDGTDNNATEPETPAPDDDGDGFADGLEHNTPATRLNAEERALGAVDELQNLLPEIAAELSAEAQTVP